MAPKKSKIQKEHEAVQRAARQPRPPRKQPGVPFEMEAGASLRGDMISRGIDPDTGAPLQPANDTPITIEAAGEKVETTVGALRDASERIVKRPRQRDLAGKVVEPPDVEYDFQRTDRIVLATRHFRARIPKEKARAIRAAERVVDRKILLAEHMRTKTEVRVIPENAWDEQQDLILRKLQHDPDIERWCL